MAIFKHRNWLIVCWALELPATVLTGVPHPSHNAHLISGCRQRAAVRARKEDSLPPPPPGRSIKSLRLGTNSHLSSPPGRQDRLYPSCPIMQMNRADNVQGPFIIRISDHWGHFWCQGFLSSAKSCDLEAPECPYGKPRNPNTSFVVYFRASGLPGHSRFPWGRP